MWFWIFSILAGLVAYYTWVAHRNYEHWKKKGVPGPRPWPLFGMFFNIVTMGNGFFDVWATKKYGRMFGYYEAGQPVLVVSDPEMLRSIMVKDFPHFVNRRHLDINGELMSQAVNDLRDQHWKDVRSVLVPAFTSGRLKQMNGLINECCEDLVKNLKKKADNGEEFDARKLFQTVTMDVIASTFFGTKVDSQNDPNNAFAKHASEAFNFSLLNPMFIILFLFPWALPYVKKLGMSAIGQNHIDFFVSNTEQIIKQREENNYVRRDFIQLMMKSLKQEGKNGKRKTSPKGIPESDSTPIIAEESPAADIISHLLSEGAANEKSQSHAVNYQLTMEEVVAQSVIFFLAGFETTATALTFLTYCLSVDQDIQEKLRQSIEDVMQGAETLEYDMIAQMQYLDACVNEALRLFPPVSRTERECNEDWEYKGLKVEKGTMIGVPIFAMHRDAEFWPNPEIFDPERFSYENKQNIKPYTFETFGQGPRNCIGMRFAYYEIKMVMVHILRNFRIMPTSRTEIPLKLKDTGFMSPKNGAWVRLDKL